MAGVSVLLHLRHEHFGVVVPPPGREDPLDVVEHRRRREAVVLHLVQQHVEDGVPDAERLLQLLEHAGRDVELRLVSHRCSPLGQRAPAGSGSRSAPSASSSSSGSSSSSSYSASSSYSSSSSPSASSSDGSSDDSSSAWSCTVSWASWSSDSSSSGPRTTSPSRISPRQLPVSSPRIITKRRKCLRSSRARRPPARQMLPVFSNSPLG